MDIEVFEKFADWFSFHLSNFDFKWSWSSWDAALALKLESHKPIFLFEALDRIVRLSYNERVKKTLPDEFHAFLPPKPVPNFKYGEYLVENSGKLIYNERRQAFNQLNTRYSVRWSV